MGHSQQAQQVRGGVSDGLAGRGGDVSSDPPSAVELLRRTGALAKVDASPSLIPDRRWKKGEGRRIPVR